MTAAGQVRLRSLTSGDIAACAGILAALPDWFGIEAANRAYIESLNTLPGAVACTDDVVGGFVALTEHNPGSVEIHVMAVAPALHRCGLGRSLVGWAEDWCCQHSVRWLHVKTRGPATPDPGYARTRAFYQACGFDPLFESLTLWGPQDAALILIKDLQR